MIEEVQNNESNSSLQPLVNTITGYEIHLPQFEGPFDLLLFFIERDEVDIYDIPISKITHDFLAYIHQMDKLQIEVASEFILVASKLMKIKAALLLPRPQLDDAGNAIDPRTELVDHLLEYKRYKSAMNVLLSLEEAQFNRFKRLYAVKELQELAQANAHPSDELVGLSLYSLLKVYEKVLNKHRLETSKPSHVIQPFPYTVEQVKAELLIEVQTKNKVDFITIVQARPDKLYIVFAFLCILEMVQHRVVSIVVGEGYNNFWLTPPKAEAA